MYESQKELASKEIEEEKLKGIKESIMFRLRKIESLEVEIAKFKKEINSLVASGKMDNISDDISIDPKNIASGVLSPSITYTNT